MTSIPRIVSADSPNDHQAPAKQLDRRSLETNIFPATSQPTNGYYSGYCIGLFAILDARYQSVTFPYLNVRRVVYTLTLVYLILKSHGTKSDETRSKFVLAPVLALARISY